MGNQKSSLDDTVFVKTHKHETVRSNHILVIYKQKDGIFTSKPECWIVRKEDQRVIATVQLANIDVLWQLITRSCAIPAHFIPPPPPLLQEQHDMRCCFRNFRNHEIWEIHCLVVREGRVFSVILGRGCYDGLLMPVLPLVVPPLHVSCPILPLHAFIYCGFSAP